MHAIILVGGRGTRLQPLTDSRPKPMLPILGRPFLEHQLLFLKSHGVTSVTFACGFMPGEISSYFGDGSRLGIKLTYALEPEPLDTAGAIAFAARTLPPQRLVVCNGDVLTDLDIRKLLVLHNERKAVATIALTPVDDPTRYGLVRTGDSDEVLAFLEKPSIEEAGDDRYINAGTYILEPAVIDRVPVGVRCNIEREIFPTFVGEGLHAVGFEGYWNDIGTFASYRQANLDALAGRIAGIDALPEADFERRSWISKQARVASGATICGGSVVLSGAVVEDGALVDASVIMENAHVGRDATIKEAIVGEQTVIEPGEVVPSGVVRAQHSTSSS